MKNSLTKKNLTKAVIDFDDCEYVIDANAATLIVKEAPDIALNRLIDNVVFVFTLEEIKKSIKEKGIIDHLD